MWAVTTVRTVELPRSSVMEVGRQRLQEEKWETAHISEICLNGGVYLQCRAAAAAALPCFLLKNT